MVVAYAQASERQGLVAAVDGRFVPADDPRFVGIRDRAVALNLAKSPRTAGHVEVRQGKGVVRLELPGSDDPEGKKSPIVVVAELSDVARDSAGAVRRASESVRALNRECAVEDLEAGFEAAATAYRSTRTRRRLAIVALSAVVVLAIIWVARSCAASGDVLGSAAPWSR